MQQNARCSNFWILSSCFVEAAALSSSAMHHWVQPYPNPRCDQGLGIRDRPTEGVRAARMWGSLHSQMQIFLSWFRKTSKFRSYISPKPMAWCILEALIGIRHIKELPPSKGKRPAFHPNWYGWLQFDRWKHHCNFWFGATPQNRGATFWVFEVLLERRKSTPLLRTTLAAQMIPPAMHWRWILTLKTSIKQDAPRNNPRPPIK